MSKCPKCHRDTATHRANVRVCPKHGILNPEDLYRLLNNLKVNKTLIQKIKAYIEVFLRSEGC